MAELAERRIIQLIVDGAQVQGVSADGVELELRAALPRAIQLRVADWITGFAGSMNFVWLHAAVFIAWMLFLVTLALPMAYVVGVTVMLGVGVTVMVGVGVRVTVGVGVRVMVTVTVGVGVRVRRGWSSRGRCRRSPPCG